MPLMVLCSNLRPSPPLLLSKTSIHCFPFFSALPPGSLSLSLYRTYFRKFVSHYVVWFIFSELCFVLYLWIHLTSALSSHFLFLCFFVLFYKLMKYMHHPSRNNNSGFRKICTLKMKKTQEERTWKGCFLLETPVACHMK